MKKFLMALMVLAVATTVSTAGVGILWTTFYGAYTHDAPNVTDYPSPNNLLGAYSAIWQLIYAGPNGAIETPDETNVANGYVGTGITGDDVVWRQRDIPLGGNASGTACPSDGTKWDEWMLWDGFSGNNGYEDLAWSTAGSVYQRVFEGTPAQGTWYYDSPLMTLDTGYVGGGAPMQDFILDTQEHGFQPNLQVPEPATMSLLGLGALVMAIRRRRRS